MDGTWAIEHNREALKRILAALVAMAGLSWLWGQFFRQEGRSDAESARAETSKLSLPRHLHRAILRLLRPAESAARRLIIAYIATPRARELRELAARQAHEAAGCSRESRATVRRRVPRKEPSAPRPLPLFDRLRPPVPRRSKQSGVPRISVPGLTAPFPIKPRGAPSPDDPLGAARLVLRLEALASALEDLPRQALRFARWQARRDALRQAAPSLARPRRLWPLRMGRPPGQRPGRGPRHEVHAVLDWAHRLAFCALERRSGLAMAPI